MHARAPFLLSILGLAFASYGGLLGLGANSAVEQGATGIIILTAVLSIVASATQKLRWQRGIAGGLLTLMIGLITCDMAGVHFLTLELFPDARYATFLGGLLALTVVGLYRGWFVARWLALGLAGGGLLSSGLNLVPFASEPSHYTWTLATSIAGAFLIMANLIGARQREHFERNASPLWSSPDPLLRSIRWTVISFMAAIPMLLVYRWMQPIVPETATTAIPLAIFLSVAVAAAAARLVIGAVALVAGGVGLLLQAGFTVMLARETGYPVYADISLYYAAFWVPAGLAALVCGARMAAPLLRLLTRPD